MKFDFNGRSLHIDRYPATKNRTLKPWNAADELLLEHVQKRNLDDEKIAIVHDRFGFLATALHGFDTMSLVSYKSQIVATRINFKRNGFDISDIKYETPLKFNFSGCSVGILKVPKSLDLFELYLYQLHESLKDQATVFCGFMTRHFTPKMVEIAGKYFENVEQSLAAKKARLLILSKKKPLPKFRAYQGIEDELIGNVKQYAGVFSASRIDNATRLLLEYIPELKKGETVLDLACGSGIIGRFIKNTFPHIHLHLLDDYQLAIASSKLNFKKDEADFHWNDHLRSLKESSMDYIFCNPPFHFEYETNIEVSLQLFQESATVLKESGALYIVANKHLNYGVHLPKWFGSVEQVIASDKYEVLTCRNPLK